MADANFTSIENNELFLAQCYFEEISDKLEKIQTIALLSLSRLRDVDQDIISINVTELIENIAGDATAVYKLEDFFKKHRSRGQEHESEAGHSVLLDRADPV